MVNPTKNYTDKFIIDCGDSVSYRLEIRRIIVPFDSSEFSANALDYAVYFAIRYSKVIQKDKRSE